LDMLSFRAAEVEREHRRLTFEVIGLARFLREVRVERKVRPHR